MNKKIERLGHDIGIEILKFVKGKKKIALFGLINTQFNDKFRELCCLHLLHYVGNTILEDNCLYFSDISNLEDICNDYEIVIEIDCVRFAEDYDIKFSIINEKVIRLTYFTPGTLDYHNLNTVLTNYEYGIVDLKSVKISENEHTIIRAIRDEYKYLYE